MWSPLVNGEIFLSVWLVREWFLELRMMNSVEGLERPTQYGTLKLDDSQSS